MDFFNYLCIAITNTDVMHTLDGEQRNLTNIRVLRTFLGGHVGLGASHTPVNIYLLSCAALKQNAHCGAYRYLPHLFSKLVTL